MNKFRFTLNALAIAIFTFTSASMAQAQATRTWVSGVGDDANPCSRTAPCKTFAGAISKTAKDGEIDCLDPGGFGVLVITKSIYINGTHGAGYGSVLASGTTGFNINITDPADVRKAVRLRSLDINGASTGVNGINILAANDVHIEDTVVDGFTGDGITTGIGIRVAASTNCNVYVKDSDVHKTTTGIRLTTTSGFAVGNVFNSRFDNNVTGVEASDGGVITMNNCETVRNRGDGVKASSATNCIITFRESITAHNNGVGLNASVGGAKILALSSYIIGNGTGINAVGTVQTDGQNRSALNGVPGAPNGGLVTIQ